MSKRIYPKKEVCFIDISPEYAKELLRDAAITQRDLSVDWVSRLHLMWSNGYYSTMHMICFDQYGKLCDGQHRVKAISLGKETRTVVAFYGATRKDLNIIDTGKRRTAKDHLTLLGQKVDGAAIASLITALYHEELGNYPWTTKPLDAGHFSLEELYTQHPNAYLSVEAAKGIPNPGKRKWFRTLYALAHYHMAEIDREVADIFYYSLATGENLRVGDPAYTLREQYLQRPEVWSNMPTIVAKGSVYCLMLRAWNAFVEGRTATKFTHWKWVPAGKKKGDLGFPTLSKANKPEVILPFKKEG